MRVRVVAGRELGEPELARWSALQRSDPALASPFFRPEFFRSVALARSDVYAGVVGDGAVEAFFPFQRRRLGFAGPVGGPISDYHGLVMEPGTRIEPAGLLRDSGLRAWDFDHLPAAQEVFAPWCSRRTESPVIEVPLGFEAYVAERKRSGSLVVQQTRRRRRKAEREVGPVRFEAEEAGQAFARILEWKSAQFRETGKADVTGLPWVRAVLERIAAERSAGFRGTVSGLYFGDRLVAGHVGMRTADVWHWWFPAYDRAFAAHSPGTILLLETIEFAAKSGIRLIDLGKGDDSYKERFRTGAVPLAEGSLSFGSVRAARLARDRAVGALRRLPIPEPCKRPVRWARRLARARSLR